MRGVLLTRHRLIFSCRWSLGSSDHGAETAVSTFSGFRTALVAGALLALLFVYAVTARAQTQEPDPWESARWRFGPLAVTPKVELKNLGWDSNVFYEHEDPKTDFTTTVAAPVDWWFRFGRGRLHGVDTFEGVYFAKYSDQSGFNQRHELSLSALLNRLQPYLSGLYLSTNDRPGYEINARVRHTETGTNAGAIIRVSSRVDLDLSARQTTYSYQDEGFTGQPYSTTLDRRTDNYGANVRYRLTSLTTLTLLTDGVRERFRQSPERDNDGFRLLPGVEFSQYALIQGKAQLGYRKLDTLLAGMPDFSGLVGNVELSHAFGGTTRVTAGVSRDIYFSYETTEPFYIQPGLTLGLTQQVSGPWDLQARGSWYRLNYQRATAVGSAPTPGREDRYRTWGAGVGYRVGRDIRVGVNVDYVQRQSEYESAAYEGIRGGMAVTYVLK